MKKKFIFFICLLQATLAATIVSGTSGFSVTGDTEVVSNDGTTITFQSIHNDGSNQGAEITHDTSASFVPSAAQPLYFQFSTVVAIIVYSDGAHKFTYDITATSGALSHTETGIEGNQNPDSNPSNYDFFAVGTGQGQPREQFELSNFAVGDMPIPEPSSGLLLLGSSLALLFRRRR